MGKHETVSHAERVRQALADRVKPSGGGKFLTPEETAKGFALPPVPAPVGFTFGPPSEADIELSKELVGKIPGVQGFDPGPPIGFGSTVEMLPGAGQREPGFINRAIDVVDPLLRTVRGVGSELKKAGELFAGDIATQVTGRGFVGGRVDIEFPSTRKRIDRIIGQISQFPALDVREVAARTFDVPVNRPINDPVQLREMAEQVEAQHLLDLATRISRQPGSTAELVGQVAAGIFTFGRAQEPLTLEAIGQMHPLLQTLLVVPTLRAVGGPAAASIAGFAPRFGTTALRSTLAGTGRGAGRLGLSRAPVVSQEARISALSRVAETEKFALQRSGAAEVEQFVKPARDQLGTFKPLRAPEDSALFRNVGDADPEMAASVLKATEPLPSTGILGLRAIQPGLTRGEQLFDLVRRVFRAPLDHELSTPAMRERARVFPIIESQANRLSQKYHAAVNDVFKVNKNAQIESLRGIDPALPVAPTIQDVAARLPTFRPHLSKEQIAVLRELENDLRPYTKMLDEAGVERGVRPDVMDGGFYIPRGRALKEGLDVAVSVPSRGRVGGKIGAERPAVFDQSAAQGIEAGYKYAQIGEVLEEYGSHAGQRAVNLHVSNYLKALRDADGNPIGLTPGALINPALRGRVIKLRNQIAGRRKTEAAQNIRGAVMGREVGRLERVAGRAGERVETAADRVADRAVQFSQEDLGLARNNLRIAIEEAQFFAFQAGENVQRLRVSKTALNAGERQLAKDVESLEKAIRAGNASIEAELAARQGAKRPNLGGLQRTVGDHLRDANQLTTRVNALSGRVEKMSARVDGLIERGQVLGEIRTAERAALVEARQTERALLQKKLFLATAERELRALTMEHNRTLRGAGRSGSRLLNAQKRSQATSGALRTFQKDLDAISTEWDRAVVKSKETPQGFKRIPLAGLEQHSFPMELAVAANKIFDREGPLVGSGSRAALIVRAYNRLIVGMNATADNSGPGIQGLMAFYNNPTVALSALKVNLQAWGVSGDRALGRFLQQYDATTAQGGRLTSGQWATEELRIGGAVIGELQLGEGRLAILGRIPVVREANRAFGFFGDVLRLEWADDMLQNEMAMGRTLAEIRASGDLRRIAEITNNMTGYSRGRTGGELGELFLFAPRFLQSRLTTVTRAAMGLRPGATLDQRIARRSILRMTSFATVLTIALNEMQGQETDFRPWVDGNPNSNFMRVRFKGRDWSLLGPWDSIAKALMLTAAGRPQDALRQLASPILRQTWDLTSKETAVGERTRDNPEQFAYYMLKSVAPFSTQEFPEIGRTFVEGDVVGGGVTLTGEVFGIKSGSLGFRDQKEVVRRELFPDVAEEDLKANQRRRILDDPRVQEQLSKLEEKEPPTDMRKRLSLAFDDVEFIKKQTESALRAHIDAGMDAPDLRLKISDFKQARFLKTEAIFGQPDIQAELQEKAVDRPIDDVLAEQYWTAEAPENVRTGELDFDLRDQNREIVLAMADQLGVDRAFITGTGKNSYRGKRYEDAVVRQMVELFEADQAIMRPYLGAGRDLAEKRGLLEVYKEWRGSREPNFLNAHPVLKAVMGILDPLKTAMRRNDIDLERKLWKWGYITTPENPFLRGEIIVLRKQQGGEITNRLAIDREPALVAP